MYKQQYDRLQDNSEAQNVDSRYERQRKKERHSCAMLGEKSLKNKMFNDVDRTRGDAELLRNLPASARICSSVSLNDTMPMNINPTSAASWKTIQNIAHTVHREAIELCIIQPPTAWEERTMCRDCLENVRKLSAIRIMGLPEELFVGYVPFGM